MNEMRDMAVKLCLIAAGAVFLAVLIAALAGCQFHFLEKGLWGDRQTDGVTVQPPPVETPSGQGNSLDGLVQCPHCGGTGKMRPEKNDWAWLGDPALWSSVAFGVVYVGNQVRKSRKYGRGK